MKIFLHFVNTKLHYDFIFQLSVIKERHFLVAQVHQRHIKKYQILCILTFSTFNIIVIINYNELSNILI